MGVEDSNGGRKTVLTYVPEYQKERWKAHADELGMSQSEFVRTMVQAGRRDFEVPDLPAGDDSKANLSGDDGGSDFERRVIDALADGESRSWDELLEALTADAEERLEATLQQLQSAGTVIYSGRRGGYTLTDSSRGTDER
ncbi:DUF5805 domain-containing protein [Halobellus sp. GM3]|uniref:DUF5805 domain-containing protein n=1 Tax=Halobellus sp. GM3 TaxID=3458410 RepID=UPI00403E1006